MFCRNCGNEIDPQAAICVKCGYANGTGNKYCAHCGKEVSPEQAICVNCGCSLQPLVQAAPIGGKSKLAAGLLAIFVGGLGVHNFYLGYTGKAVAQLLLCCTGISSIWALVEGIMILTGSINKDAQGNLLKD